MISLLEPDNFKNPIYAVGCHVECEGEILYLLRNPNKPQGNTWGAPGGKVDITDQSPEDALVREVFEETGIHISKDKLKNVGVFYLTHPDGTNFVYTKYQYLVDSKPEVKLRSEEHTNFIWTTPKNALTLPLIIYDDFTIKHVYEIE